MKRLFVAINLPPDVKKAIADIQNSISKNYPRSFSNVRWVPPENWHFTIVFLGYESDDSIVDIQRAIGNFIAQSSGYKDKKIELEKIIYGSIGRTPRMIWIKTTQASSKILGEIKNQLELELEKNGVNWQRENRSYEGHITLARFQPKSSTDLPAVEQMINLNFPIKSLDLMQSILKPTGAVYEKLFGIDLK